MSLANLLRTADLKHSYALIALDEGDTTRCRHTCTWLDGIGDALEAVGEHEAARTDAELEEDLRDKLKRRDVE